MLVRWLFAWLHLLGLGVGLGAVWARARARRAPHDTHGQRRVVNADARGGGAAVIWTEISSSISSSPFAAVIWISTGLVRMIGGLEKGTEYYLRNHVFWGKMALLVVILLLELGPAVTLGRWRRQVASGTRPDTAPAERFARISVAQAVLVVLMVLAATAMARGIGMPASR